MLRRCDICSENSKKILKESSLLSSRDNLIGLEVCENCLKQEILIMYNKSYSNILGHLKKDYYLQVKLFESLRKKNKKRQK